MRATQLTLGLNLQNEATFDNFYAAKNQQAITGLQATASGNGEKYIYLCAMRGQGRSHLLQACCHRAHQQQLSSGYFPIANLMTYSPECLNGLENLDLVCLDDLQLIAQQPAWEEAVFHLFNRITECDHRLIISANDLPKSLHLGLSDLESRLTWGVIYQLHPLSDNEKIVVLTERAEKRGMSLSEEVSRYLLTHHSRHMSQLFFALDLIDKASLSAQRRITIPFVKDVLKLEVHRNQQVK